LGVHTLPTGNRCVLEDQILACEAQEAGSSCSYRASVGRCEDGVCVVQVCGNGQLESPEMCDDGNTTGRDGCSADCLSDETCGNGVVDSFREACDDGNLDPNDSCRRCARPRCGDGELDPGEQCDDGNNESGDGCQAACLSNEQCGNGFIDFEQGEQCDDGGAESQDGCSSQCGAELPIWRQQTAQDFPFRIEHRLAYDGARGGIVSVAGRNAFGGLDRAPTIFYDGVQWRSDLQPGRPPPPNALSGRARHALAFDVARQRLVVFGGLDAMGVTLGDTWEQVDGRWTLQTLPTAPSARRDMAFAYDPETGGVAITGGFDGLQAIGDAWLYDGTRWTRRADPPYAPRWGHSLVFDARRRRLIMHGGQDGTGPLLDTWAYAGGTWSELSRSGPENIVSMAYDVRRDRTVAVAGRTSVERAVWEFDGATWVDVTPTDGPSQRRGTSIAYDPMRERVVLIGGGSGMPGRALNDIWEYDGASWTRGIIVNRPGERLGIQLISWPRPVPLWLLGGFDPGPPRQDLAEQWRLEPNGVWLNEPAGGTATVFPSVNAAYYDPLRSRVVAVGGDTRVRLLEFDGRTWRAIEAPGSPPPRSGFGGAYDPNRDRLVIFGGARESMQRNDTWEFDGTRWERRTTTTSPPGRSRPGMVYDPVRQGILLYGGAMGAEVTDPALDDAYLFDGTDWTEVEPLGDWPGRRRGPAMAFHAARGSVIFFGGDGSPMPLEGAWELTADGAQLIDSPVVPRPSPSPAMAYDYAEREIVLLNSVPGVTETWTFTWESSDTRESCVPNRMGERVDEDEDGLIDCRDPDCERAPCGRGQICQNQMCSCPGPPTEMQCADGFDEDCDGMRDCADPDCQASSTCAAEIDCRDGLDNDRDGLIDCADLGCMSEPACEPFEATCDDGFDNDGDGAVDCNDSNCFLRPCLGPE
ncbi:MAG: DUF4215 domain-containing protein, partial [Myxococcota bacterium]